MKAAEYAKAIYAMLVAALTAAAAIFVGNVYLTIALAALVPLGVYFVPNARREVAPVVATDNRTPLV